MIYLKIKMMHERTASNLFSIQFLRDIEKHSYFNKVIQEYFSDGGH